MVDAAAQLEAALQDSSVEVVEVLAALDAASAAALTASGGGGEGTAPLAEARRYLQNSHGRVEAAAHELHSSTVDCQEMKLRHRVLAAEVRGPGQSVPLQSPPPWAVLGWGGYLGGLEAWVQGCMLRLTSLPPLHRQA